MALQRIKMTIKLPIDKKIKIRLKFSFSKKNLNIFEITSYVSINKLNP